MNLLEPLQGAGYQFWSGVEGALQAVAEHAVYAAIAAALWVRKHNCHEHGCPRLGWHVDEDGFVKCKVHHPDHPAVGWFRSDRRHPRHRRSRTS